MHSAFFDNQQYFDDVHGFAYAYHFSTCISVCMQMVYTQNKSISESVFSAKGDKKGESCLEVAGQTKNQQQSSEREKEGPSDISHRSVYRHTQFQLFWLHQNSGCGRACDSACVCLTRRFCSNDERKKQ